MNSRQRIQQEFWVGGVVLVSLAILVFGIIWGKGVRLDAKTNKYQVHFKEVYGLKEGSSVLVQGVSKGTVNSVDLGEQGAIVSIDLDADVKLYQDVEVLLFTPQLMGGRMVTINPGAGPEPLQEGSLIYGSVPTGIGEVMAASGIALAELTDILVHLRKTISSVDSALNITNLGERLDASLDDMNATTAVLRDRLEKTSKSLEVGAGEIEATGKELYKVVSANSPKIDTLITQMDGVMLDVQQVATNLKSFSGAITGKEGTIGKLVYSDTLHNQIVRTLADIDSLAAKLKKEGVKIKIF